MQADDFSPTISGDGNSDYGGDGDDTAALALTQIGGVQPEIRPLPLDRALQKGINPVVNLLAELGDLRLGDAGQAHGLDQIIDPPGRDTADPSLLDDGDQSLLARLAGLQKRREIRPLPQLRDAELQRTEA